MKTKFLLFILSFFVLYSYGQTPYIEFKTKMNHVFEHVDKSKITSGLLSDYSVEIIELADFNGVPSDSNYVSFDTFLDLYASLYDAKINNNIQLTATDVLSNQLSNEYNPGDMPIMNNTPVIIPILHYEYDKLDDEAYNKGYVDIVNDQIRELANQPNIYQKKQLFASTLLQEKFNTGLHDFAVKSNYIFTNITQSIKNIEVSIDNFTTSRIVSLDKNFSFDLQASGLHTLSVRITYNDNSSYISRTRFWVERKGLMTGAPSKIDEKVSIASTGNHSGATLEIRYADNNTSKKIKKPLIIAAPFSVNSIMKDAPNYTLDVLFSIKELENLFDTYGSFIDYDLIFVNYNNSLDDIFRNATLFEEVIRYVNNKKDKTVNHPNIVLGMSMGGLVARYALRTMEINKEDHHTWKFISMDAPHKGLNFPVGIQAMLNHMGDFDIKLLGIEIYNPIKKDSKPAALRKVLKSTAMRQMLIYYCDDNIKLDNSVHENFQKEYDRIGFPQKCQNVAIVNGSDRNMSYFPGGEKLFEYHVSDESIGALSLITFLSFFTNHTGLIWNFIPGKSIMKGNFTINAIQTNKSVNIYEGDIYMKKYLLFFIPIKVNISNKKLTSTSSMVAVDGAAGSNLKLMSGMVEEMEGIIKDAFLRDQFCFIPTPSALAMNDWEKYINTSLSGRDLFLEGLTEFEETVTDAANKEHGALERGAVNNLVKHLATDQIQIESFLTTYSSTEFKVNNPKNTTLQWTTSNSNLYFSKPTNTSAYVVAYDAGVEGVITAKTTLNALVAALLGTSDKEVLYRKRIKSVGYPSLTGVFDEKGLGKFHLTAQGGTTPLTWTLSNTSDFRIVKSGTDTITIQALGYGDKATLTGTLTAGKQYKYTNELTSPGIKFYRDGNSSLSFIELSDTEIELEVRPYGSYEYIKWSQGYGDYMEFTSSTSTPKVKLKGLDNTESGSIIVEIKTNGKVYKGGINARVRIPTSISLTTEDRWLDTSEGVLKALIRADVVPLNASSGGVFTWMGSSCTLTPCGNSGLYDPDDPITSLPGNPRFPGLTLSGAVSNSFFDPDQLPSSVHDSILGDRYDGDVSLRIASVMVNEEELSSLTIGVTDKTHTDFSVSEITKEEYITFVSSNTPISPPGNLHPIPDGDPRYALVRVKPNMTGSVRCTFKMGTKTLTASLSVPYQISVYHSSYNVGTNSIELTRQMEDTQEFTEDHEKDYKAYIYNDFGIVKEVSFSSVEENISIPMHGHVSGNYYLNVRDNKGTVITNQAIPIK